MNFIQNGKELEALLETRRLLSYSNQYPAYTYLLYYYTKYLINQFQFVLLRERNIRFHWVFTHPYRIKLILFYDEIIM